MVVAGGEVRVNTAEGKDNAPFAAESEVPVVVLECDEADFEAVLDVVRAGMASDEIQAAKARVGSLQIE